MLTFPVLFSQSLVGGADRVQRGTVEVCAGGTAVEPAGDFSAPFPQSPQVLISIYELPHVLSPAPPEGAKSVFARNLHRLTRPTLTGAHGVYGEQQRHYSACLVFSLSLSLFSFFLFSFFLSNCWITFFKRLPDCVDKFSLGSKRRNRICKHDARVENTLSQKAKNICITTIKLFLHCRENMCTLAVIKMFCTWPS